MYTHVWMHQIFSTSRFPERWRYPLKVVLYAKFGKEFIIFILRLFYLFILFLGSEMEFHELEQMINSIMDSNEYH